MPDFPLSYNIIQSAKGFFQRRIAVPSVNLIKVNIVCLKTGKTVIEGSFDSFRRYRCATTNMPEA